MIDTIIDAFIDLTTLFDYFMKKGGGYMKTMAISEFKTHALKVLNEIAKTKETIIITKRGKPLAQVIPHCQSEIRNLGGRPCIYAFPFLGMYDMGACMPRRARIDAPGALHHIIGRGIERKKIFLDDGDRDNFVKRLSTILSGTETSCLGLLGGEGIWYLKTPRSHALA